MLRLLEEDDYEEDAELDKEISKIEAQILMDGFIDNNSKEKLETIQETIQEREPSLGMINFSDTLRPRQRESTNSFFGAAHPQPSPKPVLLEAEDQDSNPFTVFQQSGGVNPFMGFQAESASNFFTSEERERNKQQILLEKPTRPAFN